jgi:hypothetical protein
MKMFVFKTWVVGSSWRDRYNEGLIRPIENEWSFISVPPESVFLRSYLQELTASRRLSNITLYTFGGI